MAIIAKRTWACRVRFANAPSKSWKSHQAPLGTASRNLNVSEW